MTDTPAPFDASQHPLRIVYTNYKGQTSERLIVPHSVRFGSTSWHTEPQWLLLAHDAEKCADREFALRNMRSVDPAPAFPATADAGGEDEAAKFLDELWQYVEPHHSEDYARVKHLSLRLDGAKAVLRRAIATHTVPEAFAAPGEAGESDALEALLELFDALHIESLTREWFAGPKPSVDGYLSAMRMRLQRASTVLARRATQASPQPPLTAEMVTFNQLCDIVGASEPQPPQSADARVAELKAENAKLRAELQSVLVIAERNEVGEVTRSARAEPAKEPRL